MNDRPVRVGEALNPHNHALIKRFYTDGTPEFLNTGSRPFERFNALIEAARAEGPVRPHQPEAQGSEAVEECAIPDIIERGKRGEKLTIAESATWSGYELGWRDGLVESVQPLYAAMPSGPWLRRHVETDPDCDTEAFGQSQGSEAWPDRAPTPSPELAVSVELVIRARDSLKAALAPFKPLHSRAAAAQVIVDLDAILAALNPRTEGDR